MSERVHYIIALCVLSVWVGVIGLNAATMGRYKVPSEVHAALMALIAALFSAPLLEKLLRRNTKDEHHHEYHNHDEHDEHDKHNHTGGE